MSKSVNTVMQARNIQKISAGQTVVRILSKTLTYAFLLIMALIVLFPFYWMIISSLKTLAEYRQAIPTFWPRQLMFSNYAEAFTTAHLGDLFMNTLYVGLVSTVLSLVITVLSAFAFARLEFKGKESLFGALLATMMIPGELFTIQTILQLTSLVGCIPLRLLLCRSL
jgi:multiple sugar transport system permease protein